MAALATGEDMISRYDARMLGRMVSDHGQAVTEADLSSDTKMTTALNSATGLVKAAIQAKNLYTDADLAALTGESLAFLVDCTCIVAFWLLHRRKQTEKSDESRKLAYEESREILDRLRRGEYVLDVTANQDAGIPEIDTVSRVAITNQWNLATDQARQGNFYPRRRSNRNR